MKFVQQWFSLFCLVASFSTSLWGVSVNRINGGAHVTYVDFRIPGDVLPLELSRSYNSITAVSEKTGWNGAFGWGWTADFESVMTVTPERHVVLRDGQTGNTVIFAPTKPDPQTEAKFFEAVKEAYFSRQLNRAVPEQELKKLNLPSKFLTRLRAEPDFRIQVSLQYGLKGEVPKGQQLVSSKYGFQTMEFKNAEWVRRFGSTTQFYDPEGRLVRQQDSNGFYAEYKYSSNNKLQLEEIVAKNKAATLKFTWNNGKVTSIVDNRGKRATYSYDSKGNLSRMTDSEDQTFNYTYGNDRSPHLLTKIEYPEKGTLFSKSYRELRYDSSGLVTFHRKKDGTEVNYTYGKLSNNPQNNFWTKATYTNKTNRAEPDERYEEFTLRDRADGSKYLYRQETRTTFVFGKRRQVSTETVIFTECCGKPLQLVRDGQVTKFKYYANGLLSEKTGPKESVKLEYEPRFMKVSRVTQNGVVSDYKYDSRGNLTTAQNSAQKKVSLTYDPMGRILQMVDGTGGVIFFQYGRHGKPVLIDKKGIGTLRISYDAVGRIAKTETVILGKRNPTADESKDVVRKVMGSFHTLLDIIRPAAQVNKANPLAWKGADL